MSTQVTHQYQINHSKFLASSTIYGHYLCHGYLVSCKYQKWPWNLCSKDTYLCHISHSNVLATFAIYGHVCTSWWPSFIQKGNQFMRHHFPFHLILLYFFTTSYTTILCRFLILFKLSINDTRSNFLNEQNQNCSRPQAFAKVTFNGFYQVWGKMLPQHPAGIVLGNIIV